jgi:hypothetical protein
MGRFKPAHTLGLYADWSKPSLTVGLLPRLLTAYWLLFFGPGTRDPVWALSTLYRGHRGYRFLLVGGDDHEVSFLNRA